MTEDEENFHEYFKEDDETFLMKYNFAPSGCKILNIFCTKTNTFLLSSEKSEYFLNFLQII